MPEGFSIKHVLQAAVGFVAAFWVSIPTAVHALLVFMALDLLSGILVAIRDRRLSSDICRDGLIKKALVLIIVAAGHRIAGAANIDYDIGSAIALGFVVYEFLSIIENAGRAGVPFPPALKLLLEKLNQANLLGTGAKAAEKPHDRDQH